VDNNRPMIVVGGVVHGFSTYARVTKYPSTVFIQYGTIEGDNFSPNGAKEALPLIDYPELCVLYKDGCWDMTEVAALLEFETTEKITMSEEVKLIVRADREAMKAGASSGGW
jgi:hypothetical protein